ncbi:hypothetical protein ACFQY7_38795 [Actinomadura luteofluorescens]|uniref:hypothetical protein n=1 Tax=Actinomadura luteofluorescens TaxID=46163 RepID=UPI00362DEB1E
MQPTLDQFLTDRLDEITAEVAGEIAERVPAYTHLSPREILALVRDALAAYTGARETGTVLDAFRALGASEARAGQDVRHFESALRTGARVLIRRTAAPPPASTRPRPSTSRSWSRRSAPRAASSRPPSRAITGPGGATGRAASPPSSRRTSAAGRPSRSARSASSSGRRRPANRSGRGSSAAAGPRR